MSTLAALDKFPSTLLAALTLAVEQLILLDSPSISFVHTPNHPQPVSVLPFPKLLLYHSSIERTTGQLGIYLYAGTTVPHLSFASKLDLVDASGLNVLLVEKIPCSP